MNEYVNKNYQPDSCMLTEIINVYKQSFDKNNERKQISFKLTYETLYNLCFDTKYVKGIEHPASLNDITPFFSKIPFVVYCG